MNSIEMNAAELSAAGLLHSEDGVKISRYAIFIPYDERGVCRPVTIHANAVVEAFTVIHGGSVIGGGATVETQVIVGKPEFGYAVGHSYAGSGATTTIGEGSVVRSGAVIYAAVDIGAEVLVGHHTLLRSAVKVGANSQLGHNLTVERATWIGREVRCSPGSHITSSTRVEDRVFLGAGVRTINDKTLTWRHPYRTPELLPPRFEEGARVGTGCVVLGGVTVGRDALVGASSLVTRDIPPGVVAYGHPARVVGQVTQ
ncbi:DapH/DapD/GlmU-related protein [Kribbella sp. NPDC051952]|uniref:DapH/DapD/GlmU-related protein n=1 Tax=Kribbella sp. NPDC051952 TaxID=3154851 RepID=UPI003419E341